MKKDHESFLRPFFKKMNESYSGQWCVLHSYETLPYFSESDVDMAFSGDDIDALELLIINVANEQDWTVYQKLWYDSEKCFYYVLKSKYHGIFLALDFLIDNDGIGSYGFNTVLLTEDSDEYNGLFPIPNHSVAFSYKFVKRVLKRIPLIEDKQYLLTHYRLSEHQKVEKILRAQYGIDGMELIKKYLKYEDFLIDSNEMDLLNNKKSKIFLKSSKYLKKLYWESRRIVNRIFYPCGLIVNIPEVPQEILEQFADLMEQKTGLLFRHIKLNRSKSLVVSFKGLVGSTLIICPVKNFDNKKVVKTHWLYPGYKSIKLEECTFEDLNTLVEQYFIIVLDALQKRNRFHKVAHVPR